MCNFLVQEYMKKILISALTLSLVALTACNDFLDVVPDTRVKLTNVEQCRQLLVDAYSSSSYAAVCELSSDNVTDNNSPSPSGVRYNRPNYAQTDEELYTWSDVKNGMGNETPSGVWSGCYGAIADANAVLQALDQMKEAGDVSESEMPKFNAVRAEALLCRAFNHFVLVNVFCMPYRGPQQTDLGITYITEPETKVSPQYDRGTVAHVYEMIEKDLTEALEMVTDTYYEIPKYHFNKRAAYAFAARFYLFKREYPKVIKYADMAFDGLDPAATMNDVWGKSSQFYEPDNLGKYYTSTERPGNFMCVSSYSTWGRRAGYRFTLNREAKRCTVQGPGPTWRGCQWYNQSVEDKFNKYFAMHPCFRGMLYYSGDPEWGLYFLPIQCEQFEYTDKIQGIGYAHMVRVEFTAEETLLCRAEAKAFMQDIDGCVADLKIWDDGRRNGLPKGEVKYMEDELTRDLIEFFYQDDETASGEEVGFGIVKDIHIDEVCPSEYPLTENIKPYVQCVQHFRRIELVHTGMRWFDIKRLGLEVVHKYGRDGVLTLKSLDRRYAIQIPTEVLSAGIEPNDRESVVSTTQYGIPDTAGLVMVNY